MKPRRKIWKAVFTSHKGLYRFLIMAFFLKSYRPKYLVVPGLVLCRRKRAWLDINSGVTREAGL